MSRFILDNETITSIAKELPDLNKLGMIIMALNRDAISMKFPPASNFPIAAVCLQDTFMALQYVRIGLNECLQNKVWYREKCTPPNEELAVIYMRLYLDGIISQLYSAAEHLANAIICMLELNEDQLRSYRNHRVSQHAILGNYLAKERHDHPITKAVLELARSPDWTKCMSYRSEWVHEQPPTVDGLGPVYKRQTRWIRSIDGRSFLLGIGNGDEAEYSIDAILGFVKPAIFQFVEFLEKIAATYMDVLGKRGIVLTEKGLEVKLIG